MVAIIQLRNRLPPLRGVSGSHLEVNTAQQLRPSNTFSFTCHPRGARACLPGPVVTFYFPLQPFLLLHPPTLLYLLLLPRRHSDTAEHPRTISV